MADLTPERLQELRRIAEAATPGPWEWREQEYNERIRKRGRAGNQFRREFIYCLQGPPLRGVAPEYRDEFDYHTVMSLQWDDRVEASSLTGVVPTPEDANFIATFDPPTVLALLDEIERLQQKVQRANALAVAVEQVLKAWSMGDYLTPFMYDLGNALFDFDGPVASEDEWLEVATDGEEGGASDA